MSPVWNGDSGPWATEQQLSARQLLDRGLKPGDKILFQRDDTWIVSNAIRFEVPGTIENPIYIGGYGVGARPVKGKFLKPL